MARPVGKTHHCPRCGCAALTKKEAAVLAALVTAARGKATAEELAKACNIQDPGNVRRCLRSLVALGLVERLIRESETTGFYRVKPGQVHSSVGEKAAE